MLRNEFELCFLDIDVFKNDFNNNKIFEIEKNKNFNSFTPTNKTSLS